MPEAEEFNRANKGPIFNPCNSICGLDDSQTGRFMAQPSQILEK